MSTPIILIGYTKPAVTFPNHSHVESNDTMEVRQPILLSLLISIEPIIEIPQFSMSHLECTELNSIKVGLSFKFRFFSLLSIKNSNSHIRITFNCGMKELKKSFLIVVKIQ